MTQIQTLAAPVGRVLIALIFVLSGVFKITGYAATAGWMDSMGVPGALLPLAIILEIVGGIAIIIGWQTRWFALALAGFTVLSGVIFHADFADQNQMNNFLKNIAIAGGFLFLFANGAGAYSLDNRKKG